MGLRMLWQEIGTIAERPLVYRYRALQGANKNTRVFEHCCIAIEQEPSVYSICIDISASIPCLDRVLLDAIDEDIVGGINGTTDCSSHN